MQKMLKLALGVVLTTSLVVPAMAQENFPDVPTNHWAYEALRNLKDKVLFGYPDGLYRGNRPMSRYEFAVAINQLHQMLAGRITGLEDQIKNLEAMVKNGGSDTSGLQGLRDQLGALEKRVSGLETGHAELKKLVGEFEKELASLGVDVDALKKDVADLDARVKKLEAVKPNVSISGDATFVVLGGYSEKGNFGLVNSGEVYGVGRGSYAGAPVGLTRDLNVTHELGLSLASTNETGPKFKGTFALGNILNTVGGLSGGISGNTFAEGSSDLYIHELMVSFDHSFLGKGFSAKVGRFGHSNQDLILKRPDITPFLSNSRYDDGKYLIDGAAFTFNIGGSAVNLFGGRTQADTFDTNTPLTGSGVVLNGVAGVPTNRIYGVDTDIKVGPANLALAYVILDSDTMGPGKGFNQNHAWGATGTMNVGGAKVKASWAEGVIKRNNTVVATTGTNAYDFSADYSKEKWGVMGGYREIQAFFANPGDWGWLGTQTNPTGYKGFYGHLWFKPSDALKLSVRGDFYEGQQFKGTAGTLGLTNQDDIQSLRFAADYKLSDTFSMDASYEDVQWRLNAAPDPYQRWFTLGFNWTMSSQASARLFWQYSDADDKSTGAFAFYGLGPSTKYKGGVIGSQVSIKF